MSNKGGGKLEGSREEEFGGIDFVGLSRWEIRFLSSFEWVQFSRSLHHYL
jgi:hypothetical protein